MTIDPWLCVIVEEVQSILFQWKGECACPFLDLILIYRVLHVKDMSFGKQCASGVSDQQHTTSFYKTTLFCDHSGVLLSRAPLLQNNKYTSLVQGTKYHKW